MRRLPHIFKAKSFYERIREKIIIIKKILLVILCILIDSGSAFAGQAVLIQSTTSTKNSGFFEYILPIIKSETGLVANVVAVGTGAAIKNAEKCNGDLLIVHAENREKAFVLAGFGSNRQKLMYNDFVIIGPENDPAQIGSTLNIQEALKRIAYYKHRFVSRGDDSGTNIKELELWELTGINPNNFSGDWYLELGSGMGTTLNAGVELNAYVFTDRATWISYKNKQNFQIIFEGDTLLFNQYGIVAVNPSNCPSTKYNEANKIITWLISSSGQKAIKSFNLDGQQLFFPNSTSQLN